MINIRRLLISSLLWNYDIRIIIRNKTSTPITRVKPTPCWVLSSVVNRVSNWFCWAWDISLPFVYVIRKCCWISTEPKTRIKIINKSVTIQSNAVNSPTKIIRIKGEIKAPNATATPVKPVQGPVSSPAE